MFGDMPLATAAAPTPYSRISPQPTIHATLHDAGSKYQIASLHMWRESGQEIEPRRKRPRMCISSVSSTCFPILPTSPQDLFRPTPFLYTRLTHVDSFAAYCQSHLPRTPSPIPLHIPIANAQDRTDVTLNHFALPLTFCQCT